MNNCNLHFNVEFLPRYLVILVCYPADQNCSWSRCGFVIINIDSITLYCNKLYFMKLLIDLTLEIHDFKLMYGIKCEIENNTNLSITPLVISIV